jgi:regulator of cell morphogenesis and NO signaling
MTDVRLPATVADLAVAHPAAGRIFEGFGLDYCCNGNRTLAEACEAAGLDPAIVEAELERLEAEGAADTDTSWTALDPPALAAHIVATHHAYLHEELPRLDALAAKVLSAHGDRHPELKAVRRLVEALRAEIEPHLMKEELVLFPAIDALAAGERQFPFGSIGNPIRMMMMEHDRAGEILGALREATRGYAAPEDGCTSYRSLYERLAALEADTHQHILKENHSLFPAALRLAEG